MLAPHGEHSKPPPLAHESRPGEILTVDEYLACCLARHGAAGSIRSVEANVAWVRRHRPNRALCREADLVMGR